jgi:Zn-dependent protease
MTGFHLFNVGGIPVSMSPWFAVFVAYVGLRNGDLLWGAMFGVVVFVSLLVHELGHALVARRYGLNPSILLHGLGGLTSHRSAPNRRADVLLVAAGPAAGLSLGFVSLGLIIAASLAAPDLLEGTRVGEVLYLFATVNLFWNVLNLAPMIPLDGGKLFEHLVRRLMPKKPVLAMKIVHGVGTALAGLAVAWGLSSGMFFLALMAGFAGYTNFQALRTAMAATPSRAVQAATRSVLADAVAALSRGEHREAARLAHLARTEAGLDEKGQLRAREVIVLASSRAGLHDDAVRFFRLAPKTADTVDAVLTSLLATNDVAGARALLAEHGGVLPADRREGFAARTG